MGREEKEEGGDRGDLVEKKEEGDRGGHEDKRGESKGEQQI